MKLASRIEDAATDGSISREAIDELAEDAGVDRAQLYAAAVLCDDVAIDRRHHVQLVFCTGGCQQWGALDRLEHALAARDRGNLPVDIVPRACLDRCEHAPAVELHSPDGLAVLPAATDDSIDDALAASLP